MYSFLFGDFLLSRYPLGLVHFEDIEYSHSSSSTGILRTPSWLDSLVGRALLRYRRGHGFESHLGLSFFFFFQALISQLLKLCA